MGLSKLFSFRSAIFGPKMKWYEPWLCETRLCGQLCRTLALVAGIPLVAGLIALVIAACVSTGSVPPAVPALLVAIMGLIASVALFGEDIVPGTVTLSKKGIHRTRYMAHGQMMTMHIEDWPFESIEQCRIVLRQGPRKNLSTLEIHTADDWERVGLSKRVDLRQVAAFLRDHGVSVSIVGGALPTHTPSGILTPFNVFRIVMVGLIVVAVIVVTRPKPDVPQVDDKGVDPPTVDIPRAQPPENPRLPENPPLPVDPQPASLEMKFPDEEPSDPPVDPFAHRLPSRREYWS